MLESTPPLTKEEFQTLAPLYRGYWVCRLGSRRDSQVPAEANPYPPGSFEATEWNRGRVWAIHEVVFHDG
jgi:hypothetical protein